MNTEGDGQPNEEYEQPAQHAAPVLDVLGDQERASEEGGQAPPPPTGESFGVATPVRPPGLSKKTLAFVSIGGLAFLFLLIVGIAFGISSKADAARGIKIGDTPRKPFIGQVGGGLAPAQAFGTPVPNGTPRPYSPLQPVNGQATATPFPSLNAGARSPVCQVQPGYAGPAQPGCATGQRTAQGTQQSPSGSGGGTSIQSTPTPAEIAAQHERDEEVAYVAHEAQAAAFVGDRSGNDGSQMAVGNASSTVAVSGLRNVTQQNTPVTNPPGAGFGAPAPTAPPTNYLNVGVGTWIPITTKGKMDCNSGGVTAQVREYVPDVSGTYPLIPPYSTVVGQIVPVSSGHCDIVWTLLRLPNQYETSLQAYHTQDSAGKSGVGGLVDDHRWSIARTALYASGVAAAAGYVLARVTQPPSSSNVVVVTQTSPSQQAITAAIGPIQSGADRLINLDANKAPNVYLDDGTHLNIYVDSPIYLPVWQGVTP